jgi:hypothetical protein
VHSTSLHIDSSHSDQRSSFWVSGDFVGGIVVDQLI